MVLPMFQSTHPHGVRRGLGLSPGPFLKFQSTHPHGVRRKSLIIILFPERFNPRTRTGCDKHVVNNLDVILGFNPRTRTGCDLGLSPGPFF